MADENVHVHIRITSDKREIAATRRELERLSASARAANADFADLNDTLDDHNDRHRRLQRNSQGTSRSFDDNGSAADRLSKKMRKTGKDMDFLDKSRKMLQTGLQTGLKFALIGAAIEMVAMGAAIASVNGLFGLGKIALKGYQLAMNGLAYAAAAGVAALATFAAAQREYNAAITAFSYKSAPALGAGINQSMAALRNLTSDSRVAVFGMQNLNAAFSNVSKNANLTKPLQDAMAGIGDFAVAAGGDIGKNFAQAAEFIGLLKKEGNLTADVMSAATKVGPQFEKALKESGKTTADDILAMLTSGSLAEAAGVKGALGTVNSTLMGQAKSFFTQMQSTFADLGQLMLPGVKTAFDQLQRIVRVTFMRISGQVAGFGTGRLLGDVVKIADKLANVFVNLFDKYLPKSMQIFGGIGDTLQKVRNWWNDFVRGMESLRGASSIINSAFGTAFRQIFEGFGGSIRMFAKLITDNQPKFVEFGNALAGAFKGIQDFFNGFKEFFVSNLPIISTLIDGLGSLLGLLGKIIGGVASIGKGKGAGPLGSLLSLGLVGFGAYGVSKIAPNSKIGKAGKLAGRAVGVGGGTSGVGNAAMRSSATINTSVVYLNTRSIQGPTGPIPGKPGQPGQPGQALTRGQRAMNSFKNWGPSVASLGTIAALSQYANEDANPFLAGGAMVSMINPYAGAAVAGLGTAVTSKTPKGGALSGAVGGGAAGLGLGMSAMAAGASFGAITGSAVPVLGTAIGAAIGATLGVTVGYANQQAAERDQSRALARERVQGTYGKMFGEQLFGTGGPEGARQVISQAAEANDRMQTVFRQFQEMENALGGEDVASNEKIVEQMKKSGIALSQAEEDLLKNQPHLSSYFKSMQKQTEGLIGLGEGPLRHFEDQTGQLAGITGTTTKEISDLAQRIGVDLLDPTRTLTQNLKDLGLATVLTGEQIKGVQREIYTKNIAKFLMPSKEFEKAQNALDQAAEGIRQSAAATTPEQARDFVGTLLEQELLLAGGDPVKAMRKIQTGFLGTATKAGEPLTGDAFKNALSPLYGREEAFTAALASDSEGRSAMVILLDIIAKNTTEMNQKTAQNTLSAIAGAGLQVAGGGEATYALNTAIQERMRLLTQATIGQGPLAAMGADAAQAQLTGLGELGGAISQGQLKGWNGEILSGETLANRIELELGRFGITTDIMNQPEAGQATTGNTKEMADYLRNALKEGVGKSPDWLNSPPTWYDNSRPTWWQNAPAWYASGSGAPATVPDTHSPRAFGDTLSSTLGRTMARHRYFDGGLPGKRTITSGWRNFSLGSLKSDHLTGNAYDLTGQNLVGYANAVNGSGGFAEFHGSGAERHLHVVPGQTPIGDSVSSMTPMISSGGGGGTYSYNINVYPSAGQDPAAIAQEVMNRIEAKEKSTRERS